METEPNGARAADVGGDAGSDPSADGKRERSTIEFPYMDLAAAVEVARGVFDRNGSADCQLDELAAQLSLSPASSGFRTRIAAARVFGLINAPRGSDAVSLTDLGLRVVDKDWARKAKAEAFLHVPLFRAVYEEFKGSQLPPALALQRQLEAFGVAHKQAERARQILERSAEAAGFYESGRNRLVRPAGLGTDGISKREEGLETPPADEGKGDGGATGGQSGSSDKKIDPIIRALLAHLPPPKSVWPNDAREAWLNLLKGSFALIYKEGGQNSGDARSGKGEDDIS